MENASKALSMAASVIIGVLLVALLLLAYNRFVQIPKQQEQIKKTDQMAEFNKKYESYSQANLKGNQFRSLLNMVLDNNERNKNYAEYQIHIYLQGKIGYYEKIYEAMLEADKEQFKYKTFEYIKSEHNGPDGRISSMTFKQK